MNYYFAYGLTIAANIDFPELHIINPVEKPDVQVHLGEVPKHLEERTFNEHSNISISATEYFLYVAEVASFYVTGGDQITISPIPEADFRAVRIFFLSNAMAAILYQRKSIPMHASAIYDTDGIVLFLGDSGAGKSTTIASLQAKGYRVFSDDVCVPVESPEGLSAYAAYPMMKLWKDSFEKANIGDYDEAFRIRPKMEKYGRLFNESFDTKALRIKRIFILQKSDSDEVQFRAVKGIEAFKYLQQYAYRPDYIEEMGAIKDYFGIISALSNQIQTHVIVRPDQSDTLSQVLELIESHLDEKH